MLRLLWPELRAAELHFARDVVWEIAEACKCPRSRIWSTKHPGDARASSFVSVLDHFYLAACALCVQKECCIPRETFSAAVYPPPCPHLCCMGCLTNLWRSQVHVCTNTGTSRPLLTTSLPIPPFRLCGGNLEMLQGRALELDNICQETSTKDPCKALSDSSLCRDRVWTADKRQKRLCPRRRSADAGASVCAARRVLGNHQSAEEPRCQRSPKTAVSLFWPAKRCRRIVTSAPLT